MEKRIWPVILVIVVSVLSLFLLMDYSSADEKTVAKKASAALEKRWSALDELAMDLLTHYAVQWPDLGKVPEDMVLYRYKSDTLDCWYNLFSVETDDISPVLAYTNLSGMLGSAESPLKKAGPDPTMIEAGGKWYIIKLFASSNRKVIAGLVIKDETRRDRYSDSWTNPCLHVGNRITLTTLEDKGSEVYMAGTPVFKVTAGSRSSRRFFTPFLNADIGVLDSFGDVLLFNAAIFLSALILYFLRRRIRNFCAVSRFRAVSAVSLCALASIGIIAYCMCALVFVVGNSPIALEPRRFASLDWYSLCIFVSFASLCVAAMLVSDLALSIIDVVCRKQYTLRKSLPMLICAIVFSAVLCTIITRCEFRKERERIAVLSSHLALSRDRSNTDEVPPFFSYARYRNGRLVDFKGTFAYPLVLSSEYADRTENSKQNTILKDGYRHFINHAGASEIIVLSREELGFISFFVMFSFLVIFLFLFMYAFRIRKARHLDRTRLFSTRIKRLIILSLVSTLVVMAAVSVVFVYQRNGHNYRSMMSAKISSVQIILDSYCSDKLSYRELLNPDFIEKLQQTAKTTRSDILLYSPSGRLVMCSSVEMMGAKTRFGRIEPEAYKTIMLQHERYCVHGIKSHGHRAYILYAPVMNAEGNMIAIACVPNIERDLNIMRDAVFHAATVISVFMLILFIVVLVVTSITNAAFMPLWTMGKKMSAAKPTDLELIDYKGVDEISVLVQAYNNMVMKMRSSTVQLAQAERDRAWSEMARQVAHEIKNPLTPIKLELQRIMRLKQKGDPSWEEKLEKASDVILEHIDILSQTASEFSTFAKLYSEAAVEFDLGRMIQDQIFLFEGKGVDITYLGMDNVIFSGPKPQLTRVVFNVLNNAVQAVEGVEDPGIVVSLRTAETPGGEPCIIISVEDNGPGVSDGNLDKLFTPNFTTKSGGTGLGLAICRNVIENCGGTINYSRGFSLGGACFNISLPLHGEKK